MFYTGLGMMHNVALGRSRGDFKKDGLQGCHGVGGILDNRVITLDDGTLDPRCLTLGSASVNASHINKKKEGTLSEYPGVYPSGAYPSDDNWVSHFQLDNTKYRLGRFPTEIDAANAYAWVDFLQMLVLRRDSLITYFTAIYRYNIYCVLIIIPTICVKCTECDYYIRNIINTYIDDDNDDDDDDKP